MRRIFAIVLLTFAVFFASPASADSDAGRCLGRIESSRAVGLLGYDAFSAARTEIPVDLEIRNRSGETCNLLLNVTGDSARRILRGPAVLDYDVFTNSGDLVRVGEANGFGVPVTVAGNRSLTVRLLVRIPVGQMVPPGAYADILKLSLRDIQGERFGQDSSFALFIRVEPRAQINIAGTSAAFGSGPGLQTVDFGILTSGAERQAHMQLRSNTRVLVNLSSENQGRLANTALSGEGGIPYTLTIDGQPIALGAGQGTISRRPGRTLDGQSYPMVFRVPEVGALFAGRYSDVITINIMPQE